MLRLEAGGAGEAGGDGEDGEDGEVNSKLYLTYCLLPVPCSLLPTLTTGLIQQTLHTLTLLQIPDFLVVLKP